MKFSSSPHQNANNNHNNPNNESTKPAPNCLIVLPFLSSPPFNSFIKQSANVANIPSFQLLTCATTQAFTNFQSFIASFTHKWLKEINFLASRNPIIQAISQRSFEKHKSLDLSHHNFAAILPGDSVAGIVAANGILNFLNIYNSLLVVRLVLTWFPSAPPAIVSPLSTLCDPYLNIFRGIIPPLGGTLDLSPILAFLVLNAFTSAATALPAELPSVGEHTDGPLQTPGTRATST
ncbi:hypothetical protein Leryth_007119 [Lithospermum erythrorhizon]|nr:hypothetical protein Leryth_007119 [Lithospermum erythrorhizon]